MLGGDIGSGRGWVVVVWRCGGGGVHQGVLERWVWGSGPVGLWAGRGSFAALGMCVMRVMPHEWAWYVHRVFWKWASYTYRGCLRLALKGPVWGLYRACVGLVYGLHGAPLRRLKRPATSCSCQC